MSSSARPPADRDGLINRPLFRRLPLRTGAGPDFHCPPVAIFDQIRYNGPVLPPHPYTLQAAYLENAAHRTPGRVTAVRM